MDFGSALTIASAWISLALWSVAIASLWARRTLHARKIYGLGLVVFLIHIACAMHFAHGWSHSRAFEFTAEQSEALTGIRAGWGLYLNHLFAVVWLFDWWRWRRDGDARYAIDRSITKAAIRAFALFMFINGAVVFVAPSRRWLGVALLLLPVAAAVYRRWVRCR